MRAKNNDEFASRLYQRFHDKLVANLVSILENHSFDRTLPKYQRGF